MSPICAAVGWGVNIHYGSHLPPFEAGVTLIFPRILDRTLNNMSYAFRGWSEPRIAGWWGMETPGEEMRKVPYELIRGYVDVFEVLLWIGIAPAYLA
jgi:hypothetical protein